jgi:hypothetical protein
MLLTSIPFIEDEEFPFECNSILVTKVGRIIEFSLKACLSGIFSIE